MENVSINFIKRMEHFLNVMSDTTRLRIMLSLLDDSKCTCNCEHCSGCEHMHCMIEKSVNEIVEEVDLSQSLVSHQLSVLRRNNLVKTRKEGTKVYYSLNDAHVKSLLNIVREHLEEENHGK